MADAPYIYLGTASQFPTVITSLGRRNIVAGIDNIKQALTELLTTPIGSVFFNRAWGSRLYLLLFEPNDTILESLAISFVNLFSYEIEGIFVYFCIIYFLKNIQLTFFFFFASLIFLFKKKRENEMFIFIYFFCFVKLPIVGGSHFCFY